MKLSHLPVGIALLATSLCSVVAAPIVAEFKDGESDRAVDAYIGRSGNGWKGPWRVNLYGTNIFAETEPNPTGAGNSLHITMTSTSDLVEGNKQGALWREFDGLEVDPAKPLQYTFNFRLLSELNSKQKVVVFNRSGGPHAGTDASDTWAVSGDYSGWKLGGEDTGILMAVGKTYTITINVNPAAKSWVGTIADGTDTFTSGEQTFRVDANSDGRFLHLGGVVNGVGQKVEFAIDSIKISAIE